MVARAYELTQPRTMDQMLISAFPSVFLVYFQWHHNFRKVYPKEPPQKVAYENNQKKKRQAEDILKNKISYEEGITKARTGRDEEQKKQAKSETSLNLFVLQEDSNKKEVRKEGRDYTVEKTAEERKIQRDSDAVASLSVIEQSKKQNSL